MKKRVIIPLVTAFILSLAGTALGAENNPFSTVPAKHWAYESVVKLVHDGLIDGYADGDFRGDKPATRYEMATMVAKAMSNLQKADAKDQATVEKLKIEFSDELTKLGVRVANLEKKSKFDLSGDLQFRDSIKPNDQKVISSVSADYRFRIYGIDQITDQTSISFRIGTEPKNGGKFFAYAPTTFSAFGQNGAQNGTISTASNANTVTNTSLSQAYVTQKVGKIMVSLGEIPLKLDSLNILVNSSAYSFDGLKFEGKTGVINWAGNWGRFQSNVDVSSLDGTAKRGKLTYGGGYARMWDSKNADWSTLSSTAFSDGASINRKYTDLYQDNTFARYFYADAKYDMSRKVVVGGLFVHNGANTVAAGNKNGFYTYAQYGSKNLLKAGDANLQLFYYGSGLYGFNRFLNPDYPNSLGKLLTTDAVLDVMAFRAINLTYNYAFNPTLSTYLTYEKVDDKDHNNLGYGFTLYRIGMVAKF